MPTEYDYEITPRTLGLGGGWNLRLLENGEEVGGGGYWKEAGSVETDREALSVSAQ